MRGRLYYYRKGGTFKLDLFLVLTTGISVVLGQGFFTNQGKHRPQLVAVAVKVGELVVEWIREGRLEELSCLSRTDTTNSELFISFIGMSAPVSAMNFP